MTLKLRHRLLQRGYLAYSRVARGMTLGVRAVLLDGEAIVLVKHSYMPGWYLPGGGVEAGETLRQALEREIGEEVGAVLTGPAQLFGMYRNAGADARDHVALFVCRDCTRRGKPWFPNREITAMQRFPLASLPAGTTRATHARIGEVFSGATASDDW